jgi:RNA polymerase sigma-70 factor (ECF subfamily)
VESDEELLCRATHAPEAFEPLVARHTKALHGYFTRRAGFDAARGSARGQQFGVARLRFRTDDGLLLPRCRG